MQTQNEDKKDVDGEDGPRPKHPRSSADRLGSSEVDIWGIKSSHEMEIY